ncbi:MAG: hypothetical protein ACREC9_05085 [Methylocella sp.]
MSVQVQLRRDVVANILANFGAQGEVWIDTTYNRLIVNDGATKGGFSPATTIFVGNSGSTNNSSTNSGTFVNHTPTFTIPANFMTSGRAVRVTTHFQITTGTGAPVLLHRLSLGTTALGTTPSFTPGNSQTNVGFALIWIFQATAAPGASVNVQCSLVTGANGGASAQVNTTAMPVAVATNAANAVTIATEWATAGTGTNTISLNQLIVEALN